MPSTLPDGDPAPASGLLPEQASQNALNRSFSLYVHIPFCSVRCGYCDFNTYTALELGGGASQQAYGKTAENEVIFAAQAMDRSGLPHRKLSTVFFGGGTPTLLPADDLADILNRAKREWGLLPGAEVTTEANPDSVTPESLDRLARAGFTRISFGMQSSVPHVLATLDRTHRLERVPQAVQWAREAGLDVSLDLIYGTPGESVSDWQRSVEDALAMSPDHVSAYSLIVEPGTKLAAQMRRGDVPEVDDDDHAEKYELADDLFSQAGFSWYEVSNFAKSENQRCQHNLAYWHNQDWWGIGPGAHSHIGGVRWWNVKHPIPYASKISSMESPAAAREVLDEATQELERLLLGVRLREGVAISSLGSAGRNSVPRLISAELIDGAAALRGVLTLTLRGRLLADAVVRDVVEL